MFRSGLIVSCQIPQESPLYGRVRSADFALAVEAGGAVAIRTEGAQAIKEIKAQVQVPVIGLIKLPSSRMGVYITATMDDVKECIDAGADYVAIDATGRPREGFNSFAEFVYQIKTFSDIPLIGDVATLSEGILARDAGVSILATTLAGYTESSARALPDLELVSMLVALKSIPVVAEGGYRDSADVNDAFGRGAYAVCVGAAITDPWKSTRWYVNQIEESHEK